MQKIHGEQNQIVKKGKISIIDVSFCHQRGTLALTLLGAEACPVCVPLIWTVQRGVLSLADQAEGRSSCYLWLIFIYVIHVYN